MATIFLTLISSFPVFQAVIQIAEHFSIVTTTTIDVVAVVVDELSVGIVAV